MRRYELKGQTFGRLTAVRFVPTKRIRPNGKVSKEGKWLCTCSCGMTTMSSASDLVSGRTKSCGCLHRESIIQRSTKHGGRANHERLYNIWYAMRQRCYYNGCQHRKNYSMKGIQVCDEWRNDYAAFREWAYANGYYEQPKDTPHGEVLSIDRIDPNGDYSPDNCQWISCSDNVRKRFTDTLIRGEGLQECRSAAEHR